MDFAQPDGIDVVIDWHNVMVDFYAAFVESFRNNKKVSAERGRDVD